MRNCLALVLTTWSCAGFMTLKDADYAAQKRIEHPPIENNNLLNPRYSQMHTGLIPSWMTRVLMRAGLVTKDWLPADSLTALRTLDLPTTSPSIVTRKVSQGAEIYIVGPLHGSFHSLVRNLAWLETQGVLTEQLTLKRPEDMLIFMGDAFSGSPYALETLTLIMTLMARNKERVWYLQGAQERQNNWRNGSLKHELRERAPHLPHLPNEFARFFSNLPMALDLQIDQEDNIIRITHSPERVAAATNPTSALITAEQRMIDYSFHQGLSHASPTRSITTWSVFSAPNDMYRRFYRFGHDAFAKLKIQAPIEHSTISLYNRAVDSDKSFELAAAYSVVSAQDVLRSTVGTLLDVQQANTITLGSTIDLSRTLKALGLSIKAGMAAALNWVNNHGGINGKFFRLIIEDDEYTPTLTRAYIEQFRTTVSPIIHAPLGSPTVQAVLDLITAGKIYVLFPLSGSVLFRNQALSNIINFRASLASEAQALIYYAKKTLMGKNFAFFYQDDAYGYAPLQGAQQMLKSFGIDTWTSVPYQRNTVQIKDAVKAIKKANPEVICLFSVTTATTELIKELGAEFLANKKLLAISPLGDESFKQFVESMGLTISFAQVVPNPVTSPLEIVSEYRRSLAQLGHKPDTYSLEGFIVTRLTAHILGMISGPITTTSVANAIEQLGTTSYKGLSLSYDPATRQLSNKLWIETESGLWIEQKIDELTAFMKQSRHQAQGAAHPQPAQPT